MERFKSNVHIKKTMNEFTRERKIALKTAGFISIGNVIGKILSIPSSIIVSKFLGPQGIGVLAIINLFKQYIGYAHLGLLQSMTRNVPVEYGKKRINYAQKVKNVVFTGYTITIVLGVLALWTIYLFKISFNDILSLKILIIISFNIIINRCVTFLKSYAKAEGQFISLGKIQIIRNVVTPIGLIIGVYFYNIIGALIAALLSELIVFISYIINVKRIKLKIDFDINETIKLLKTGFMIFSNKMSESIFWSIGIIIISYKMGKSEVGIYSLALNSMNFILPFVEGINMVVYRKMMVETGNGKNSKLLYAKYISTPYIVFMLIIKTILGIGIIGYMILINNYLFKFSKSIPIMIILAFGYMVYSSRYFLSFYLDSTKQLHKRLIIILTGLMINIILSMILVSQKIGMVGVAISCTLSFYIIAVSIVILSIKQIVNFTKSIEIVVKVTIIAIVLCALLFLFYRVIYDGHALYVKNKLMNAFLLGTIMTIIYGATSYFMYGMMFSKYKINKELIPVINILLKRKKVES